MKSEKRIEQEITLEAALHDCTLFKNNVGTAYRGTLMMLNGKQVLTNLQFIKYGLGGVKGSSDQIGVTKLKITQDMVGKDIGVFTAIEVKKDKYGAYGATHEQKLFLQMVKDNGGIAFICDNADDVKDKLAI